MQAAMAGAVRAKRRDTPEYGRLLMEQLTHAHPTPNQDGHDSQPRCVPFLTFSSMRSSAHCQVHFFGRLEDCTQPAQVQSGCMMAGAPALEAMCYAEARVFFRDLYRLFVVIKSVMAQQRKDRSDNSNKEQHPWQHRVIYVPKHRAGFASLRVSPRARHPSDCRLQGNTACGAGKGRIAL